MKFKPRGPEAVIEYSVKPVREDPAQVSVLNDWVSMEAGNASVLRKKTRMAERSFIFTSRWELVYQRNGRRQTAVSVSRSPGQLGKYAPLFVPSSVLIRLRQRRPSLRQTSLPTPPPTQRNAF